MQKRHFATLADGYFPWFLFPPRKITSQQNPTGERCRQFLRARVRPARGEPFLGGGDFSVKNRDAGTSLTAHTGRRKKKRYSSF